MTAAVEVATDVLAIGTWRNNAELIRDGVVPLGYLADHMRVLDPTWGLGRWWSLWRPADLVGSDGDARKSPTGGSVDFRRLPWPADEFDAVAFDPPYKLNGTSDHPSDAAYGVAEPASRDERHQLIRDGIVEAIRVTRPGGHVLAKCQDQVNSGRVWWQTHMFAAHAEAHGAVLVDALHLTGYRPQPPGRSQQHARRNYSTLLVLEVTAMANHHDLFGATP